jgi:hypothetical protein
MKQTRVGRGTRAREFGRAVSAALTLYAVVLAANVPARAERPWDAYILRLKGKATLSGSMTATLSRFAAGQRLTLSAGASAEIVRPDGTRVRVSGPGTVTLAAGGTIRTAGGAGVTPLKALPVAFLNACTAAGGRTDSILGGVVLRGRGPVTVASPSGGLRDPAPAERLEWTLAPDMPAGVPVTVTLREAGAAADAPPLLGEEVVTPANTLAVAPGKVVPGRAYEWSVSFAAPGAGAGSSGTRFRVLTDAEKEAVAAVERAAAGVTPAGPGDDARERMLGAVYAGNGLYADALRQFEAARRKVGAAPDPELDEIIKVIKALRQGVRP